MHSLLPDYAELHCLSNFSFLRGASHPEELVERAAALGYSALAITDECSFAGVVRAHGAAKDADLPLVIGTEITLTDGLKLVLLAINRASYGALSKLITLGRMRSKKGTYSLQRQDLEVDLHGSLAIHIPHEEPDLHAARWVADRFPGRSWVALELLHGPNDYERTEVVQALSRDSGLPIVAAGDVHMHLRSRQSLQDVATAIRIRKPVSECGFELFPNAERHLRPKVLLAKIYAAEYLAASVEIAKRCAFNLDVLRYEYPEEIVPPGSTPAEHLRNLTEAGLARRFPAGVTPNVRELIERELGLIAELKYEPYFLTVHDIVAFAKSRSILCQGRGSAANSAVCYALSITEVDPARSSLLFERFISRERNEPPDIDVDFEHERREEVIQYIYGKYGRARAALAAVLICYRPKSALRDVGKALGLELADVDRIAKSIAWWDGLNDLSTRLQAIGYDPELRVMKMLAFFATKILGFPRHLSQHPGGFVIARGALSELVPIENAAMEDRSVIQWDKDDLDAVGLLKVDVLALGMLTAIRKALDMVGAFRRRTCAVSDVPAEDPAVYEMLQQGDSVGVFQVESRAQMTMLPRLKPACFYDLVIEVAIVRPGPIQGGMVHPYLRRRQGIEPVEYASPAVKGVLERTLGIPIFQEQVMQLAMVAADFTAGDADRLRRAMAAWKRKGGLEPFEEKLKAGMAKNGYKPEFADQIFKQILGFGEYGFPESHSASFALLVYVSAWIKKHEPAAFLAALLNSQPMGFYGPSQLVQDARRHNVEVRPVDVLISDWDCTLEHADNGEPAVRLGFRMARGISAAGAARLVEVRRNCPLASVQDLAERAKLDKRDIGCLASAGAFESLVGNRRQASWAAADVEILPPLLKGSWKPPSAIELGEPSEGETVVMDYRHLGLSLGRHPLALLRDHLKQLRSVTAADLAGIPAGRRVRASGLVTCRQRPGTASGVVFVTLEDETGNVNVIVWRDVSDRQRDELLAARLMTVDGELQREGLVTHVVAHRLTDHSELLGDLTTSSRDFH